MRTDGHVCSHMWQVAELAPLDARLYSTYSAKFDGHIASLDAAFQAELAQLQRPNNGGWVNGPQLPSLWDWRDVSSELETLQSAQLPPCDVATREIEELVRRDLFSPKRAAKRVFGPTQGRKG